MAAQQMQAAGHLIYLSENKVWLTDVVPADYRKLAFYLNNICNFNLLCR
jgi:RNA:NAD 2'-phosphotransferase (TPT1/KptA family)